MQMTTSSSPTQKRMRKQALPNLNVHTAGKSVVPEWVLVSHLRTHHTGLDDEAISRVCVCVKRQTWKKQEDVWPTGAPALL